MRTITTALGVAALALAGGCAEPELPTGSPGAQGTLSPQVLDAYTAFGLRHFAEVAGEAGEANVVLSPTSIALALAMTQNGAAGETLEAMGAALGTGATALEVVNSNNAAWLASLASADPKVQLSVANSLWARQGIPVREDYLERVRETYRAEVATLNFASPAAPQTINAWIRERTAGQIREIVPPVLDPQMVLYLINAVHFKGSWTRPFDPRATSPGAWRLPGGETVQVPLMRQTESFRIAEDEGARLLALPYGAGRFEMVVLLPEEGTSLGALRERLTPERWRRWTESLRQERVAVTLPRFRLEYEQGLIPSLTGLGMGVAFDSHRANFEGMLPRDFLAQQNAYISSVQHKTVLEINELGTEASGGTAVGVGVTSMPPEFTVDRPFLMAIRDTQTGTLLFVGQIVDPR